MTDEDERVFWSHIGEPSKWEPSEWVDIEDFMAGPLREQFAQPQVIITSRKIKERYAKMLERQKRYQDMLEDEKSWLMRYMLQRRLGYTRLRLLWPWADKMRGRMKWIWLDWKHRKDPEW